MSNVTLPHFSQLRSSINARLRELGTEHSEAQIGDFPWLFGALGQVPSKVIFICENPSLKGVRSADVDTLDGGPPDIEAQWCGGPRSVARKRLRRVLCEVGLKTTPETEKGGWTCYITNVVKEANIVSDQRELPYPQRMLQAEQWSDVLRWELEQVAPTTVFCVGGRATAAVRHLMKNGLLPQFGFRQIWHYSARGADDVVRAQMLAGILKGLNGVR